MLDGIPELWYLPLLRLQMREGSLDADTGPAVGGHILVEL
jgi:hypothetical protein